jgi:uncharacterized membrane protein
MLSFQAADAAPIIMMSQKRQSAIDRIEAKHDCEVNQKLHYRLPEARLNDHLQR